MLVSRTIGVVGIAGHLADLVGEWADGDELGAKACLT